MTNFIQNKYEELSPESKTYYDNQIKKRKKSIFVCYLLFFLFGWQYAYLRKWGLFWLYILTFGGFGLWLILDLFRIPFLVKKYNDEQEREVMKEIKFLE